MKKTKGERIIDMCKGMPDGETQPFVQKPEDFYSEKKLIRLRRLAEAMAYIILAVVGLGLLWVVIRLMQAIVETLLGG